MDETLVGLLASLATALLALAGWFLRKQFSGGPGDSSLDMRPARPVRLSEVDRGLIEEQNKLIDRLHVQHERLAEDWQRQTDTVVAAIHAVAEEISAERREAAARAARTEEQLRHQERSRRDPRN